MSTYRLSKADFGGWIDGMTGSGRTVVGVKAKGERFAFGELESADELRLDYDVTILPPKKYVLPQVETLMTYDVGGGYRSRYEGQEMVLVGVHPYDMVAINQMDMLFSQDEYDSHYMKRRERITIVACDVAKASENVFASSMGTATVKEGYDVLVTDIGEGYVVEAATEKGEALLKGVKGLAEASWEDMARREAVQEKNKSELNKHPLKCGVSELPGLLEDSYDHPVWDEKAQTCFSCGSCNTTCPTCYCFDVQDDVEWDCKEGRRYRQWDGCLLRDFANVAGGHNFRKEKASRFRHRLYRKGKYVPSKIGGQIACVGCGRCITACVAKISNPVEVYNRLFEDAKAGATK